MTNVQLTLIFSKYLVQFRFSFSIISQIQPFSHNNITIRLKKPDLKRNMKHYPINIIEPLISVHWKVKSKKKVFL